MSHSQMLIANNPIHIPTNDPFEVKSEQLLPDSIIWIYIASIVIFGVLLNLILFGVLFKIKTKGTTTFIIQLVVTDLISLGIAYVELLYMNNRKWIFESALCPVYLGLESITSTASVYFIVAINLHAVSTYNLAVKTLNTQQKYLRASDSHHLDDENHELDRSQQRSITIDYSKRKETISVMCPIFFIWFLSISVSIPLFTYGALLPNTKSSLICGLKNFNHGTNVLLQLLVLHIRIIIPSLCLVITFLYVGYKYLFTKSHRKCRLTKDVNAALKLGFILSIVYILFCTQRVYGSLMFEVMTKPFMQYKYPAFDKIIGVILCMINYTIPAFRPFIYIGVDRNLRAKIENVCKNRKQTKEIDIR